MKSMTTTDLLNKLQAGETVNLIDVRNTDEVATGKIAQAVNIPLHLLEAKMPDLNKQTPYAIICHAGGRSAQATQFLESYGFDVTNVTGGMLAWEGPTV